MRRSRLALSLVLVLGAVAVGVACSPKSSDSPTVVAPPDAGSCVTQCCELPEPNTLCLADAGTRCTYLVTCSEGLLLSRSTTCTAGVWQSQNDCPGPGFVDERGCPSAQPAANSACSAVDGGGFPSCTYSKVCQAKVCDGGDCQQVQESARANCVNGSWQTTPLPPC